MTVRPEKAASGKRCFTWNAGVAAVTSAWQGAMPAVVFNSLYSRGQSDSKEKGTNQRCRFWPEKVSSL